jgi:hypothetical protein
MTACQLPLVAIRQVVVTEAAIFVVGAVDKDRGAVLHSDEKCAVLHRWDLGNSPARLVMVGEEPRMVSDQGTLRLLANGEVGPLVPHVQGAINRARMGQLHWLQFRGGTVLCHNQDLTMRTGAPGWCALQASNGWKAFGPWDDAMMCSGWLLLREPIDGKRVRWTSLQPGSGEIVARGTMPRGTARCVDDRFLLNADTSLRVVDAKTLVTRWTVPVGDKPVDTMTALPGELVYTMGDDATIHSVRRTDEGKLKLSPRNAP